MMKFYKHLNLPTNLQFMKTSVTLINKLLAQRSGLTAWNQSFKNISEGQFPFHLGLFRRNVGTII